MSETAPIAASDELVDSRAARERHAGRVEVLDKVKALQLLPGDVHVTTEMVANYYVVPVSTINSVIEDNRDELVSNGLRKLAGAELIPLKGTGHVARRASSLVVFTRRTILNVGMLLRDSLVARRVRAYLLDTEQAVVPSFDLTSLAGVEQLLQAAQTALTAARQQEQRAVKAETKVAALEPLAEGYLHFLETDGTVKWANACEHWGVGPDLFGAHLRRLKILRTDEYISERSGKKRQGERHNRPYADYTHWFHFPPYSESERLKDVPEHRQFDRRVTKAGMEGLRKVLKRHVVECGRCSMCNQLAQRKPTVYACWRPRSLFGPDAA